MKTIELEGVALQVNCSIYFSIAEMILFRSFWPNLHKGQANVHSLSHVKIMRCNLVLFSELIVQNYQLITSIALQVSGDAEMASWV